MLVYIIYTVIVILKKEINRSFFIIDSLEVQVDEIRNMLKTLIHKEEEKDQENSMTEMSLSPKRSQYSSSQNTEFERRGSSRSIYATKSDERGRSRKRSMTKIPSQPRSKKLRSRLRSRDRSRERLSEPRSDRSNRSKKGKKRINRSPSPSHSSSSSPASQPASQLGLWIFYDDIDKELKLALRVTFFSFISFYL